MVENSDNIALWLCPRCRTSYLAVNNVGYTMPQLYKLSRSKARVYKGEDDGK